MKLRPCFPVLMPTGHHANLCRPCWSITYAMFQRGQRPHITGGHSPGVCSSCGNTANLSHEVILHMAFGYHANWPRVYADLIRDYGSIDLIQGDWRFFRRTLPDGSTELVRVNVTDAVVRLVSRIPHPASTDPSPASHSR